jgi:hypothetical protein
MREEGIEAKSQRLEIREEGREKRIVSRDGASRRSLTLRRKRKIF